MHPFEKAATDVNRTDNDKVMCIAIVQLSVSKYTDKTFEEIYDLLLAEYKTIKGA